MKIAFWSEETQVETAFHMSLMACAFAWMRPVSIAAISGGYQGKELEKSLIRSRRKGNAAQDFSDGWEREYLPGSRQGGRKKKAVLEPFAGIGRQKAGEGLFAAEQQEYFVPSGLDCLLGKRREDLTEQAVLANMHPVVEDRMYCLPGSKRPEQEWWHKDPLFTGLKQVLDAMEECFNIVFVDCGNRKDDFAQWILKEADICVLNMDQESELIGDYYRNPPKLRGKVFFLIGNYFEDGLYTRRNLQRLYRVDEDLLGAIPYHAQMKEAARAGRIGTEVRNYVRKDRAPSYTVFGQELSRAARLLLQLAGTGN